MLAARYRYIQIYLPCTINFNYVRCIIPLQCLMLYGNVCMRRAWVKRIMLKYIVLHHGSPVRYHANHCLTLVDFIIYLTLISRHRIGERMFYCETLIFKTATPTLILHRNWLYTHVLIYHTQRHFTIVLRSKCRCCRETFQ